MKCTNEKLIFSHILILRSVLGKAVIGNQSLQWSEPIMSVIHYQIVLPARRSNVMALSSYIHMTSDWGVEVWNDSRADPQSLYLLLLTIFFAFNIFCIYKDKVIYP